MSKSVDQRDVRGVTEGLFQLDKEVVINLFQICYRFVSNCMVIDGPKLVMFFSMKGT